MTPTLPEISHQLSGATCFSKLDAKDSFWSIHLNEKLSYLTTFNTHYDRYRFLHMPFGLKMSQGVFQMHMDQVMDHLPGIIVIHDDICIYSHTPEGHDWHFLKLMKMASQHSVILNNSKCQIRQPQTRFYGAVFTTKGLKHDPSKSKVLQDLPTHNSPV